MRWSSWAPIRCRLRRAAPRGGGARRGWGPAPLGAGPLARWCRTLVVTLGPRGAAYFTGDPVRTALIPAEGMALSDGDPTGCGDVLGATVAASLAARRGHHEGRRPRT